MTDRLWLTDFKYDDGAMLVKKTGARIPLESDGRALVALDPAPDAPGLCRSVECQPGEDVVDQRQGVRS